MLYLRRALNQPEQNKEKSNSKMMKLIHLSVKYNKNYKITFKIMIKYKYLKKHQNRIIQKQSLFMIKSKISQIIIKKVKNYIIT